MEAIRGRGLMAATCLRRSEPSILSASMARSGGPGWWARPRASPQRDQRVLPTFPVERDVSMDPALRPSRCRRNPRRSIALDGHRVHGVLGQVHGNAPSAGVPEFLTHGVPLTVEPQTIVSGDAPPMLVGAKQGARTVPAVHSVGSGPLPARLAGYRAVRLR
jgi:hypothetical protein